MLLQSKPLFIQPENYKVISWFSNIIVHHHSPTACKVIFILFIPYSYFQSLTAMILITKLWQVNILVVKCLLKQWLAKKWKKSIFFCGFHVITTKVQSNFVLEYSGFSPAGYWNKDLKGRKLSKSKELVVRIMCQSEVTCLPVNYCFSELAP
jgi:hypothetical protein